MSIFFKKNEKLSILEEVFKVDGEGVVVFDRHRKIKLANDAIVKMSGYSSADAMMNGDIFDVLQLKIRDEAVVKPIQQQIEESMQGATGFSTRDCEIISARGETTLSVELSLQPFLKNNEQMFLVKLRDLTDELERERVQAEFITTASHEMRTPVTAIQGYIDLALNPEIAVIDSTARGCLKSARAATERLGNLFKNLLDTSRIDRGKMQPHLENINVRTFVENLKGDFEMLARNKKQFFELEFDAKDVYCSLDFVFFQDILTNLVENAIKYTPEGGEIKLKIVVVENSVKISVSDTGAGISEDDMKHIFQKFYRSDNTNLKVGGSGLGLYLTKERVEMMGGKIEVSSTLGKGSTFTITLPRIVGDSEQAPVTDGAEFEIEEISPVTREELRLADPFGEELDKFSLFPKMLSKIVASPFINMSKKWQSGKIPSTSEEDKRIIYEETRKYNKNVTDEQFDKVWNKFLPRLENPGLAKLMKNFAKTPEGFESEFIIPWMLTPLSAISWEFGFGQGRDFTGRWREFPKEDRAYRVAMRDPEFAWVRKRAIMTRKEIAGKEKVLFLNAGCLPELRNISYYEMPKEVWACDEDATLNTKDIFGWSTAEHHVHYEIMNMVDYISKMSLSGLAFDVIVMNGATIYYYEEFEGILKEAAKVLKPGGKILLDVQLLHWDLLRSRIVFNMNVKTISQLVQKDEAISNMVKICREMPNFRLKYAVDDGDNPPVGVMFYLESAQSPVEIAETPQQEDLREEF